MSIADFELSEGLVRRAIGEFDRLGRDAFLTKYSLRRSRSYFFLCGERQYDSKAVVSAALSYLAGSNQFPKVPTQSLAAETVQALLEKLGFTVITKNPGKSSWTWEERTLALSLYLREGQLDKKSESVAKLSAELNERAFHPDAGSRPDFRNPNGVALKLANFAALDPSSKSIGMGNFSAGDEQSWEQFADDEDALERAVMAIRTGSSSRLKRPVTGKVIRRQSVEAQHTREYEISKRADSVVGRRREAELVMEFESFLRSSGIEVSAHHYRLGELELRNDIADDTNQILWEAKGSIDRSSVRMALGQLLDYARFEDGVWRGGVLLPRRPSADLLELIHVAGRLAAWRTGPSTFAISSMSG